MSTSAIMIISNQANCCKINAITAEDGKNNLSQTNNFEEKYFRLKFQITILIY
jgi:hypothetical protein